MLSNYSLNYCNYWPIHKVSCFIFFKIKITTNNWKAIAKPTLWLHKNQSPYAHTHTHTDVWCGKTQKFKQCVHKEQKILACICLNNMNLEKMGLNIQFNNMYMCWNYNNAKEELLVLCYCYSYTFHTKKKIYGLVAE